MEENKQPQPLPPTVVALLKKPVPLPSGKREFIFGGLILLFGWLLVNSLWFGGFNLGAAIALTGIILLSTGYLLLQGHKLTGYSATLLALCLVLCAAFARSNDAPVKVFMVFFLIGGVNLSLCLLAGQNRFPSSGICSLADIPRTVINLTLSKIDPALRGLIQGLRNSGNAGKKGLSVVLGLAVAFPVLLLLVFLLSSADAAFDALLSKLPDFSLEDLLVTLIFGTLFSVFFYIRAVSLHGSEKEPPKPQKAFGVQALTVNTVLIVVAVVYLVYLFSQLAYFSGGFLGLLPEEYTVAEYARRGFFELGWLCGINLLIIALAMGLVKGSAPKFTRFLCLFVGLVTVFFAASASAKMFLYIDSFGLTRLRVLTQVIIFWLGLTTVLVCIWLFVPKLSYMKAALILAMVLCAAVAWADVNTVVARYNVNAYQSGKLETVDVDYLQYLGPEARPYIAQLTQDADPDVAQNARDALNKDSYTFRDFRDWNYVLQLTGKSDNNT